MAISWFLGVHNPTQDEKYWGKKKTSSRDFLVVKNLPANEEDTVLILCSAAREATSISGLTAAGE